VNSICVFCGAQSGARGEYLAAAEQLGRLMAARGIGLVYGGGGGGMMGAVADAVRTGGGRATGVIPERLIAKEQADPTNHLRVVNNMHERKALMGELSDAFIVLPGGLGTLEELFEVWTWRQLGFHRKPCGLLNVAGFYDTLLQHIAGANQSGFIRQEHRDLLLVAEEPGELLEKVLAAAGG